MTSPVVNPVSSPSYSDIQPPQRAIFTVADMINQVTRQFGDEANVQINNTDIVRWINMGLVEISRSNRVWEKTAILYSTVPAPSVPGVVDQSQYTIALPNDCNMLQAVRYNGVLIPGFDFEQLISQVGGKMHITGTPSCYYMWAGGLSLYPLPDTAGLPIMIYYRGTPPFVSGPSDGIPLPDKYFDTLEAFVMSKAYELDEDWTAQGTKKSIFDKGVSTLSEETDAYAGDFYTVTDPIYEYPGGWW